MVMIRNIEFDYDAEEIQEALDLVEKVRNAIKPDPKDIENLCVELEYIIEMVEEGVDESILKEGY
jgi:hypothetical protein